MNRYIKEQGRKDEDRVVKRGRAFAGATVTGVVEDGHGTVDGDGDGKDSFGPDG